MNIETKEVIEQIRALSTIVVPLLVLVIKKVFKNRLKEEEFEEQRKPDGTFTTKRRRKYK